MVLEDSIDWLRWAVSYVRFTDLGETVLSM